MDSAPPPESVTLDLPVELKVAIADAVTVFANLDNRIIEILWVIENADLVKKRQIAKTFAAGNQAAIRAHIEQIPGAETDKIWPALDRLRTERNLIVHGVWAVANDGRPLVIWHGRFLECDDFIGAEYFEPWRFERYMKIATHLLDTFTKLHRMLDEASAK